MKLSELTDISSTFIIEDIISGVQIQYRAQPTITVSEDGSQNTWTLTYIDVASERNE